MKVLVMEQIDESGMQYRRSQPVAVIGVCAATEEAALAFAQKHFRNPRRVKCAHIVFDLLDGNGNQTGWFLASTEYELEDCGALTKGDE